MTTPVQERKSTNIVRGLLAAGAVMFVHKSSFHQHNQAAIVCGVGVEHRWTPHLILAFSVASVA